MPAQVRSLRTGDQQLGVALWPGVPEPAFRKFFPIKRQVWECPGPRGWSVCPQRHTGEFPPWMSRKGWANSAALELNSVYRGLGRAGHSVLGKSSSGKDRLCFHALPYSQTRHVFILLVLVLQRTLSNTRVFGISPARQIEKKAVLFQEVTIKKEKKKDNRKCDSN